MTWFDATRILLAHQDLALNCIEMHKLSMQYYKAKYF